MSQLQLNNSLLFWPFWCLFWISFHCFSQDKIYPLSEHKFISNYLKLYPMIPFDEAHTDLALQLGKKLEFYFQKRNPLVPFRPEEKELQLQYQKIANFLYINKVFKTCLKDPQNEQQLPVRVLAAAGKTDYKDMVCLRFDEFGIKKNGEFTQIAQLENYLGPTEQLPTHESWWPIADKLPREILEQIVKSYLQLTLKFDSSAREISHYDLSRKIAYELCQKSDPADKGKKEISKDHTQTIIDFCTPETKIILQNMAQVILLSDSIPDEEDLDLATININHRIMDLNLALKNLNKAIVIKKGKIDLGLIDTHSPDINDRVKYLYQIYLQEYVNAVSVGAGMLLLTPQIREKMGPLRLLDKDLIKEKEKFYRSKARYYLPRHELVQRHDLPLAIEQAKANILAESQKYVDLFQKRSLTTSSEKALRAEVVNELEHYPLIVGRFLGKNPEFTPQICNLINELNRKDLIKKRLKTSAHIGVAVLGVGLTITGIGSGIGSIFATGSIAASLQTIGTIAGVTGMALNITKASAYAGLSLGNYLEQLRFENAFLAGIGDAETLAQAHKALINFQSNSVEFAGHFGASLVDIFQLNAIISTGLDVVSMAAAPESSQQELIRIRQMNDILTFILSREDYIAHLQVIQANLPTEKFQLLMAMLSTLPIEVQKDFLDYFLLANDSAEISIGSDTHEQIVENWNTAISNVTQRIHPDLERRLRSLF